MAGAPKGNKNALKHGLYAGKRAIVTVVEGDVRRLTFAIRYLENAIDKLHGRMMEAEGEELTRLGNTLSSATAALCNVHRTMAYLAGGMTPIDDALKELMDLKFTED